MEMITVKIKVGTNYFKFGDALEVELPRDEWERLSDKERDEVALESVFEMMYWEVV